MPTFTVWYLRTLVHQTDENLINQTCTHRSLSSVYFRKTWERGNNRSQMQRTACKHHQHVCVHRPPNMCKWIIVECGLSGKCLLKWCIYPVRTHFENLEILLDNGTHTCTYTHSHNKKNANSLAAINTVMCTWHSQGACALSRHYEPVQANSWSPARSLQEDWPRLSAYGCGHPKSHLNPKLIDKQWSVN